MLCNVFPPCSESGLPCLPASVNRDSKTFIDLALVSVPLSPERHILPQNLANCSKGRRIGVQTDKVCLTALSSSSAVKGFGRKHVTKPSNRLRFASLMFEPLAEITLASGLNF